MKYSKFKHSKQCLTKSLYLITKLQRKQLWARFNPVACAPKDQSGNLEQKEKVYKKASLRQPEFKSLTFCPSFIVIRVMK